MTAQQAAQEIQAATPYLWEIVSFCFIIASHFITNKVKKIRWLPAFLCDTKYSKERGTAYLQAKRCLLILCAMAISYAGVSWSLLQRYDNTEQVYVITALICALQWLIVEVIFSLASGTKYEKTAEIVKGNLYVPSDATAFVKTVAYATGGGVDRRDK